MKDITVELNLQGITITSIFGNANGMAYEILVHNNSNKTIVINEISMVYNVFLFFKKKIVLFKPNVGLSPNNNKNWLISSTDLVKKPMRIKVKTNHKSYFSEKSN